MKTQQLKQILDKAKDMCGKTGGRLTEKRKKLLTLLVVSEVPMSAYELADAYSQSEGEPMPAMSVYRILEFLESEQLVHKLSSTNKYIACSHIACDHAHEVSQFLICGTCERVKEIAVAKSIIDGLSIQVSSAGYQLMNSQLELDCLCNDCAQDAA